MTRAWTIAVDWQVLNDVDIVERNCFGSVGIEAAGLWITEGYDLLSGCVRRAPLVCAYQLAEWFAWNWWRLRWEPHSSSDDWLMAHQMSSIGGGFIWPNITLFFDGEQIRLLSRATRQQTQTPFTYHREVETVIPSCDFESVVDDFVELVLSRLTSAGTPNTNLAQLWRSVCAERLDPTLSKVRKLEALAGHDRGN